MKNDNNIDPISRVYWEFSCWAARRAWAIAGCKPCEAVVLTVEAYLRGEASVEEVRAAYQRAKRGLSGAGACGIPRAMPSAAAQVAACHVGDELVSVAVRKVIHHVAATAGYAALGKVVYSVLSKEEAASSWRNLYVWRKQPEIEVAGRAIEKAILEGELHRRLAEACEAYDGRKRA
jgi:hypothetical protein